jgi:hypothetical protein
MYLMHQQSDLLAHIQNTNTQYNLPGLEKRIGWPSNRTTMADHFEEPMVRASIEAEVLDRCMRFCSRSRGRCWRSVDWFRHRSAHSRSPTR